jgi:hypothetical protein
VKRDFAAKVLERSINHICQSDIARTNQHSVIFVKSDNSKKPDFDANTTVARLQELRAILLLADGLSFKDELTTATARQVRRSLAHAYVAFRRSSGIWWHGYGNFLVTASVFSHSQGKYDEFTERLTRASKIFHRTNDLSRKETIERIIQDTQNPVSPRLDKRQIGALLFGE